jgi:hypothetical protein
MRRRKLLSLAVLCLLIFFLLLWWIKPDPDPVAEKSTALSEAVQEVETESTVSVPDVPIQRTAYTLAAVTQLAQADPGRAFYEVFRAPVDFWGKVVDEKGNPVAGARIEYSLMDHPEQGGKQSLGTSDAMGLFSLTGKEAANLYVKVSKEGYYELPESARSLNYYRRGKEDAKLPTKDNPAIFVLKKKGDGAALISVPSKYIGLKNGGAPTAIDLQKGKVATPEAGDLLVECWVDGKDGDSQWNWKYRVTIPGGGIAKRPDVFSFEAPQNGYQPSIEGSTKVDPASWSDTASGDYFIKLKNGTYARASLTILGRHQPTIDLGSIYLNPEPGNRNLEYDPAKRIKP